MLNAIDLFSGCGGFSHGLEQAGFNVACGVDNVSIALDTFANNHPLSKTLCLDLHEPDALDHIASATEANKIDLIVGGPPCQGFSLTGTRKETDPRNTLFYSLFNLGRLLNPKALIIENVPGLVRLYKGKAVEAINEEAAKLGYNCTFKELFAPDYGVPQIRRRVFFVMLKKELGQFQFPQPTHNIQNYITCGAAISDLPSLQNTLGSERMKYTRPPQSDYQRLMRRHSTELRNHVGTKHTDHVISVISQVPEGGNHKDLPPGVGDSRKFNEAWTRYHRNQPSRTIDTGHRNHFHYKWNRVPTVRENARLQSFPDDFVVSGTRTQQYRQIGNAVPPLLGLAVGNALKPYLE